MDLSTIYEGIKYIKPEISASVFLILIVLFDLIYHRDKKYLRYLSLAGIIVTGIFIINQFGITTTAFFTSFDSHKIGMITVDPFAAFFKLIVILSSFFIIFFSLKSDEIESIPGRQGEYYGLIWGLILGMLLLTSATDFILIYLSIELMSLSSYVLAGFTKLRERNSEAALKYLIYGATSSGLMLFGISIIYGLTGTTNLYDINCALQNMDLNPFVFSFAVILIFAGIGYKISAVPFHFWTPDVYEGAPLPITAYLSVASKAAGFAVLIRIIKTAFFSYLDSKGGWHLIPVFDWQTILLIISIITMTLGNLTALWQDNLKRLLAYSSIAHAGYMLLAIAALSNEGTIAVMVYFFFYLFMNLGAFFVVMIIAKKNGSENIHDLDGLGAAYPLFGVSFIILLISLVGLPPTAGFIGKLYIFFAIIDANLIVPAVIMILNTVISLYYYMRVAKHLYLAKTEKEIVPARISILSKVILLLFVAPTLLFGIYFTPVVNFIKGSIAIFGF